MKKLIIIISILLSVMGCASDNRSKGIPIHELSIGMNKNSIVEKLGKPRRVMSSEVVNNVNQQIWMYQQDNMVWLTGNAFLGGQVRNDQVTYLLFFEDDKLIGWKDNDLSKATKSENTFELRNR